MQRTKRQHTNQMEKEEANQVKWWWRRRRRKNDDNDDDVRTYETRIWKKPSGIERAQQSKRARMIENRVYMKQSTRSLVRSLLMCVKKFIFFYAVADSYRCFIDIRSWIDFFLLLLYVYFLLGPVGYRIFVELSIFFALSSAFFLQKHMKSG